MDARRRCDAGIHLAETEQLLRWRRPGGRSPASRRWRNGGRTVPQAEATAPPIEPGGPPPLRLPRPTSPPRASRRSRRRQPHSQRTPTLLRTGPLWQDGYVADKPRRSTTSVRRSGTRRDVEPELHHVPARRAMCAPRWARSHQHRRERRTSLCTREHHDLRGTVPRRGPRPTTPATVPPDSASRLICLDSSI